MTDEVNAAIAGALDGGATSIIVTDGHNNGRNILIEQLRPPARLISGSPAPLSMVQGAANVDVACFIGYHARAGTPNAILCHTWTDEVRGVWLNDVAVGEIGLNAAVCGHYGVPIELVTGDQAAAQEAIDLLGPLETVAVKRALGRMAAECFPVADNHRAIRAHALAPEVDFFSIGTNDLTQYTLAAERGNAAVTHLQDALHPAVLIQIRQTVQAAETHGKWVGVCGELAGDPLAIPILIGLGGKELSMASGPYHNAQTSNDN